MNLCTRCLAPVGHEQGDEMGRCPRCAAEQAVIKAARELVYGAWYTTDEADNLVCEILPSQHNKLKAALLALDGDPA